MASLLLAVAVVVAAGTSRFHDSSWTRLVRRPTSSYQERTAAEKVQFLSWPFRSSDANAGDPIYEVFISGNLMIQKLCCCTAFFPVSRSCYGSALR